MLHDSFVRPVAVDIDFVKLNAWIGRFRQALSEHGIAPGRRQLEGDRCYYIVSEGRTRPLAETKIEAHRRYIDVQYVLEGAERIGCGILREAMTPAAEIPEQDTALYARCEGESFVTVSAGEYLVLFPWDLHRPGCCADEPAPVRKAVLKLAIELVCR